MIATLSVSFYCFHSLSSVDVVWFVPPQLDDLDFLELKKIEHLPYVWNVPDWMGFCLWIVVVRLQCWHSLFAVICNIEVLVRDNMVLVSLLLGDVDHGE